MKRVLEIIDFGFFSKLTVKQQWVLWGLAICLGAVLPFLGSLKNGYVIDDETIVANNPNTASLARTGFVFTHELWGRTDQQFNPGAVYRPVTILSFAATSTCFGNTAQVHHLVNLGLHLLNALLAGMVVWVFTRKMNLSGLTGLGFAIHPLHTEVVNMLVGRAELLAFSGGVGALVLFQTAVQQKKNWLHGVGWCCWLTGFLAKESTILFLPLLITLIWWMEFPAAQGLISKERGHWFVRQYGFALTGLLIPLGCFFGLRAVVLGNPLGTYLAPPGATQSTIQVVANPLYNLTLAERWKTSFALIGKMTSLHLWPHPLVVDYSFDSIPLVTTWTDGRLLFGLSSVLALGIGIRLSCRKAPLLSVSLLFWLLGMVFFSNLLLIRFGSLFGERWMYSPSLGFCIALAILVQKGITSQGWVKLTTTLLGLLCLSASIFISAQHTKTFFSTLTAVTHLVEQGSPRNAWGWFALGNEYSRRNQFHEAVAAFRKSLEIYPSPDTYDLVAMNFMALGDWNEAIQASREAIRLDPGWWPYHKRLAIALTQNGQTDEAIEELQTALKGAPTDPLLHYSLASLFKRKGNLGGAEFHYQAALQGDRPMPGAWRMMGEIYLTQGRKQEALTAFRNFIQANPTSSETGSIQEQIRQLEKEPPPQPKSEHP
ncbi:MAG: tetratricopeptide repeat protein [Blastocatellia bacterium]|nr:tetratricopeptide repeat protein [Blastocatellia bacterium]